MSKIDLIGEAKKLIRFNTVTTRSNAECAYYAGRLLHELNCRVQYQEQKEDGQSFLNVIGVVGEGGAAPLLLTSHLDTVDPGDPKAWTKTGKDPWKAVVRGDSIYGLGSADDKLDFLCKLMAVSQVDPKTLARPVMLMGTFGEERGLLGAIRFSQSTLPRPAMAIVGEPSELKLVHQHKGILVCELALLRKGIYHTETSQMAYEVEVRGSAAHSSTPKLGKNAIAAMLDFLKKLDQPVGKMKVLSLEGGTAANIIPDKCTALILPPGSGRRLSTPKGVVIRPKRLSEGWYPTLPWVDLYSYMDRLPDLLAPFQKTRNSSFDPPGMTFATTKAGVRGGEMTLTFDIRSLPNQDMNRIAKRCEQLAWDLMGSPADRWHFRRERQNPALNVEKTAEVSRMMLSGMRAAGVRPRTAAKSGCSEAGWYQMIGIPSVVFGPGQAQGNIHQPNEHNSLRQIRKAIAVYRFLIERVCVKNRP
ncbi:MAG: M20/M25/M40 family metallo-hydrolase [Candidatus Omnitrophica bacterium]|nr:M20/M25/M40 family metallo-hydrolase [Candidatus Omnitrophota bacterium]